MVAAGDFEGRTVCSSGSSTAGSFSYRSNSRGTIEKPTGTEGETEQGLSVPVLLSMQLPCTCVN